MKRNKWQFAIGTTSRVPDSGGLHYVIADFDSHQLPKEAITFIKTVVFGVVFQRTDHGFHMYTNHKTDFGNLVKTLEFIKADPVWIKIGKERGYYFLADKSATIFPWPVERMVLYIGKKETRNTTASRPPVRKKGN